MSRRLEEAFGETPPPVRQEAPARRPDDKRLADPLSSQRNVPREMANAITKSPPLRYTVWQVKRLPQGVQASRLLRYLEDKGWRRTKISGRDLLYHGRSLRLLEPSDVRDWSLAGLYSVFRPRSTADERDPRAIDSGLTRLWGMRYTLGGSDPATSVREKPSEDFLEYVSSPGNMEQAEQVADLFFQHTGIVIEPLGATLPKGEVDRGREELVDLRNDLADARIARRDSQDPDEQAELDAQIEDLQGQIAKLQGRSAAGAHPELPPGVDPEDLVLMAEGGRLYVVRAKDQPQAGVLHDSSRVLLSGQVRVDDRGPTGRLAHAVDAGVGADAPTGPKTKGGGTPQASQMTQTPQGVSVPKAWLDQGSKPAPREEPASPSVRIRGDGTLSRLVATAKKEGRGHVFLVGASGGKKSAPSRIPVTPARLEYSRGGLVDEPARVAARVRSTGGLPLQPGRWSVDDLGRYLRMFERDTGARL